MVDADDIPNAVVLYSAIVNISRVFGPALAGLLAVTLGFGWCFTLDAASYLAVLACIVMMRAAELHRVPHPARTGREVREGLEYVASVPYLWISFAMFAAVGLFSFNFRVTLPLFVSDSLHRSDAVFTILYSVFSVGAVVSALIVAHRKLVQLRHVVLGAASMGIAMLLLSAVPNLASAVAAVFLVGIASVLYMTPTAAHCAGGHAPRHARPRAGAADRAHGWDLAGGRPAARPVRRSGRRAGTAGAGWGGLSRRGGVRLRRRPAVRGARAPRTATRYRLTRYGASTAAIN